MPWLPSPVLLKEIREIPWPEPAIGKTHAGTVLQSKPVHHTIPFAHSRFRVYFVFLVLFEPTEIIPSRTLLCMLVE